MAGLVAVTGSAATFTASRCKRKFITQDIKTLPFLPFCRALSGEWRCMLLLPTVPAVSIVLFRVLCVCILQEMVAGEV